MSHPTPPLLKLWIPQMMGSTSCPWFLVFLCPGARVVLVFFLILPFFHSLQLTDCFLLLVFLFFLTHCIILTLCLIPVCTGSKIASFDLISLFFVQETKMLFPLNLFFWCNNEFYVAASGQKCFCFLDTKGLS